MAIGLYAGNVRSILKAPVFLSVRRSVAGWLHAIECDYPPTMDDAKRRPSISVPSIPLKPSATSRHELLRVKSGTHVKRINSIALPGIDTRHEIRLIQDGHAERVGDSRYRINGRVYVHKPDGSTYPESGEGIVRLTNPQFRALRLLIAHDGRTVAFNRATERDKSITDLDIEVAHGLYQLRKGSMP